MERQTDIRPIHAVYILYYWMRSSPEKESKDCIHLTATDILVFLES